MSRGKGAAINLICLQEGNKLRAVTDPDELLELKRGGMGEATITLQPGMSGAAVDQVVYE